MTLRLAKIVLVACVSFHLALLVCNNLTDYGSNYYFVAHVLSMDTTFPGNAAMGRALHGPAVYRVFYAVIIAWEAAGCGLIGAGAWLLWRHRRAPAADWRRVRGLAVAGLVLSMTLWFSAFLSVGGEWFLMWQSRIWNGNETAFRLFAILGIVLIFLCLPEEETPAR